MRFAVYHGGRLGNQSFSLLTLYYVAFPLLDFGKVRNFKHEISFSLQNQ